MEISWCSLFPIFSFCHFPFSLSLNPRDIVCFFGSIRHLLLKDNTTASSFMKGLQTNWVLSFHHRGSTCNLPVVLYNATIYVFHVFPRTNELRLTSKHISHKVHVYRMLSLPEANELWMVEWRNSIQLLYPWVHSRASHQKHEELHSWPLKQTEINLDYIVFLS